LCTICGDDGAGAPYADGMRVTDPAHLSVFLDYDGTISTADTGVYLLERLGAPEWRAVEAEYSAGEIGSRVCLLDEWDLLPGDEALLTATAAEVPIDQGVHRLVGDLRAAGAEVTIVSDGFGFYVHDAVGDLGIPIVTNAVDWGSGALEFPYEDRCCACSSCGTCKQAPIKDAHRRGRTTVLVGDGTSDRKAAALADIVYAKAGLARWCAQFGVAFTRFVDLEGVRSDLLGPG
jgi:2-hydroxy-3-keto-5-methylthiopentenyl-1-phosphate phosphatase